MNAPPISRRIGSKTGESDHSWTIIDDHIDSGGLFECTNVATLTADDPTFHVVGRNLDTGDGGLLTV